MKLFQSRKLSDPEFVEEIRKRLQKGRRWAWMMLAASGLALGVFIFFVYIVFHFADVWGDQNSHVSKLYDWFDGYRIGFMTGVFLGVLGTIFFLKIFIYFLKFLILLKGEREDRLIVAYYDELHPLDGKAPAPSTATK
jgi:hypothetical protein